METLAIVATKGGVGKTTLAVHLAAAAQREGRCVLILDLDPQKSATQWGRDRARLASEHGQWFKFPLVVRPVVADDLAEALQAAEGEGFDFVVIDTPPHADFPAARAAEVADLVLVPTRPGYFDLHAAKATIALVGNLGVRAFYVINQVPHNTLRAAGDAAAYLEGKGLPGAPSIITFLQPYVRALRDGLTAPELVPDGRHAQEIGMLWDFVKNECAKAEHKPVKATRKTRRTSEASALLDDPFADMLANMTGDVA